MTNATAIYGFISIREFEGVGYCGGLLIVSHLGRPLEFHCSTPVIPNRAQQILYGQTYPTYLLCEQIGLALIEKTKTTPNLYIANQPELMPLNTMISTPVVALVDNDPSGGVESPGLKKIVVNDQTIWLQPRCPDEPEPCLQSITQLLDRFTKALTLDEPFERIEKAIEEAQAVAR